jgi:hypothetical protein
MTDLVQRLAEYQLPTNVAVFLTDRMPFANFSGEVLGKAIANINSYAP